MANELFVSALMSTFAVLLMLPELKPVVLENAKLPPLTVVVPV